MSNYPSILNAIHELDSIKRIPENSWRKMHEQLQECRNDLHLVKTIIDRMKINNDLQFATSMQVIVAGIEETIRVIEKKCQVVLEYFKSLLVFLNESYEHLCIDEFFYHFVCFLNDFDDEMTILSQRKSESTPSFVPEISEVESVDSDLSIDSDLL